MEHARYQPDIFYVYAIDGFLTQVNASLFITYPVSNFTFDGIYDSILEGADSTSGIELPIPFDRFGWFYPVSIFLVLFRKFFWFYPVSNFFFNFRMSRNKIR